MGCRIIKRARSKKGCEYTVLKNEKTGGIDKITEEMIRSGGECVMEWV